MLRRTRLLIAALIVISSLAGASLALYLRTGPQAIPAEGLAQLQASTYPDVTNVPQAYGQWQGRIVVLNFWATWCPPCRAEMPMFSRLQTELADRGVQFVGIGVDSPSAIKEFALRSPMSYPLLIGGTESMALARMLGNPTGGLPYTLVLDRSGNPVMSRVGLLDEPSLRQALNPLL